jgi:hypothetical protein
MATLVAKAKRARLDGGCLTLCVLKTLSELMT